MAISETHYKLLQELKTTGVLPRTGRILEIGQANWYGDMDPSFLVPSLPLDPRGQFDSFAFVRLVYEDLMPGCSVTSIDAGGPDALKLDLNNVEAASGDLGVFDLSINHGTAEHIFNIANVFRLMHEKTKSGGLMIHESPCTGWVDHGFYNLQPTLFYDLASANGYSVEGVWLEHLASKTTIPVQDREHVAWLAKCDQLPTNAMLFAALRKTIDHTFAIPMQRVYTAGASETTRKAWRELR